MLKTECVTALLMWLAFAPPALVAQPIEITRADARTAARGPQTAYTGVASRSCNHPVGQYLYITSGAGWVQARGEKKRVVKAGDVVWTPPGVFHWHGATATQGLRHIAVWQFVDGSGGELAEHVAEVEYLAEPADE